MGIDAVFAPAPDRPCKRRRDIWRKTKRLAHFAHRAARPVADDGGAKPGAMPPEAVIDILDDVFALLVLEIDIDIRRFVARIRNEALEEQVGAGGIDFGDAERIADS